MPSFAGASRDRSVAVDARGVVRLEMVGQGFTVQPAGVGVFAPIWWATVDEHYSAVRLDVTVVDGTIGDALQVELWAQEDETEGGVLLGTFAWTLDPVKPSRTQIVAAVGGCTSRGWGARARMTTATARRVSCALVLDPCCCAAGVLWRGEGVT